MEYYFLIDLKHGAQFEHAYGALLFRASIDCCIVCLFAYHNTVQRTGTNCRNPIKVLLVCILATSLSLESHSWSVACFIVCQWFYLVVSLSQTYTLINMHAFRTGFEYYPSGALIAQGITITGGPDIRAKGTVVW